MARWAPGFCAGRYCRNSAEGAPDGPQAGSSNSSMTVRVSYGRATCAGHKQEYVRNELGPPSTRGGGEKNRLFQFLCSALNSSCSGFRAL